MSIYLIVALWPNLMEYEKCLHINIVLGKTPWSSGKGEDSRPRGRGFETRSRCRDHLSFTINLDQTHES